MTERALKRQRTRESLILISFTIFSVFLMYVTATLGWWPGFVPLLAVEVAFVWWAYMTGFRDHTSRAIIITLFACVSIFFYGMHSENFNVILPTMCVFTVLFGLYQLRPVFDLVFATQILLLLYHIVVKQSFIIPENTLEADRMALQLLSWLVCNILVFYSIFRTGEIEEEVASLDQEIARVQKIKDDFVANTSHELRTPINTISGMSEILLQEDLSESAHREALDIQMTGIELHTIVSDIMDYAALEADMLALAPRAYNITSTINDVMNMTVFQNREKNLEVIFDCDPGIPCLLYGDEQQLRRVMNNLIGNAIKFTNEGGVTVNVGFRPEEYGVNLLVRIKDTGIGLSEEQQEQIFQSFYQADTDRSRTAEGLGLGLTISSALIKRMGGFLTVSSQQGQGSEFSFSIPQKVMDDRPCIALTHPERVNAIWYYNAETTESLIRDDYIDHINHIQEHLDILMHRSSSLSELRRRLRQGSFTHLFIGLDEYLEDTEYFDEVSSEMSTILIIDRDQQPPAKTRMHILYKPYNAMTLAEMFNGGDILDNPRKYQEARRFEAPTAKVLVVDDNLMNLKVVEGLLRKYRIKITAASSGEEALAQIESRDYDFVFMDHMMPGMDGIECFHAIRNKEGSYFSQVPIIALTANAIAGAREMFLEEGFSDFVAKPIDNALLNEVLETYIPEEKKRFVEEEKPPQPVPGASPEVAAEAQQDPFTQMEGIDMATALTYCGGSLDDYIDLVRVYLSTSGKTFNDIVDFHDRKDWKNYAILVHALKSSSKTIGASKLAEIAYTEEMAAKAEDVDTIEAHHEALLAEYKRVLGVLAANPEIAEDPTRHMVAEAQQKGKKAASGNLTSLDITEWDKLKAELTQLLETFEGDAVEQFLQDYQGRSYKGVEVSELLSGVMAKVEEFDFAGALEELETIGGDRA